MKSYTFVLGACITLCCSWVRGHCVCLLQDLSENGVGASGTKCLCEALADNCVVRSLALSGNCSHPYTWRTPGIVTLDFHNLCLVELDSQQWQKNSELFTFDIRKRKQKVEQREKENLIVVTVSLGVWNTMTVCLPSSYGFCSAHTWKSNGE